MLRRLAPASLSILALIAAASAARADVPAASLVRVLTPRAVTAPALPWRHPLADETGRVPLTVTLPPGADARALGLLPVAPGVGAVRLDPADVDPFAAAHPDLALGFTPPMRTQLDVSKGWTRVDAFRADARARRFFGTGRGVVVGIIDTGLDVRHPDFRDAAGKTRVAWMLRAGSPLGVHADVEAQFGCTDPKQQACGVYDAAQIDALIGADSSELVDALGHGTHVTSIAAGNGGLMKGKSSPYVGIAPEATLVIANPSSGGGFYDADVLNAARFIFDRADALGMPAVINLSVGGDFGPHDGTSALEAGLAAMVGDDNPGRAIVVAAGNSGALTDLGDGLGSSHGTHTEVTIEPYETVRVPIRTPASTAGNGFVWITFDPSDAVDVALVSSSGATWVDFVSKGSEAGYKGDKGTTAGIVNAKQGTTSNIPAANNGAVVAWAGAWPAGEFAILLRGAGHAQLWVTGEGSVSADHDGGLLFDRAVKEGTVTVPGSSPGLLAVGCTINRIAWKPLGADPIQLQQLGADMSPLPDGSCYFSAAGPTPIGVPKPELSAPGAFVAAAMSSLADPRVNGGGIFDDPGCPSSAPCYVVDDRHAITSGTSMSSPHVAGAAALLFEIDPTLTQGRLTEVLQAGARKPGGHVPFDYQVGPGELDLVGAWEALAVERASTVEPDLAKSWYALSSPYARPDTTAPVRGTIELRRADGTIAGGLDGTRLAVSIENGTLVSPLAKVRQGLFRFSFGGAAGAVGETVRVDVTYDGVSLGARTLPIGTDAWTASGEIGALGGCSCGVADRRGSWSSGLGVLGVAALAAVRARRRRRI